MALYETPRTAPFGAITTLRVINAVEATRNALSAWNTNRQTRNALSRLTDRELDDIGLIRGDLDRIGN